MSSAAQARVAAFLARRDVAKVLAVLNGGGVETRLVGGAVRDLLLGEPAGDVDLATTALPEETIRRGEAAGYQAISTGIAYGTVTLVGEDGHVEVTTLRRDVETDGRHAKVAFGTDFAVDALRRDFTINALSLDAEGRVHDYCAGLDDLATRRIRFIGDASARIAEDYLRILRFFRFHARLGQGPLDREGLAACTAGRAGLDGLSRERVRAEMLKLLAAPGAADALDAMAGAGLLVPVLGGVPHLARFRAVAAGEGRDAGDPALRLAALAVVTREDALRLDERLRLSRDEADRIGSLAMAQEALAGRIEWQALAALRRLALRVGADALAGALLLLTAGAGSSRPDGTRELVAALGDTPAFLLAGRDVLALGIAPGPRVGRLLATARAAWIEAGCPAEPAAQARLLEEAARA